MEYPSYTKLCDRLKWARNQAGKKQVEVARAVGIAAPTYSELEKGKYEQSRYTTQIARFLNVDAHWLATNVVGGNEPKKRERIFFKDDEATENSSSPQIMETAPTYGFKAAPQGNERQDLTAAVVLSVLSRITGWQCRPEATKLSSAIDLIVAESKRTGKVDQNYVDKVLDLICQDHDQ